MRDRDRNKIRRKQKKAGKEIEKALNDKPEIPEKVVEEAKEVVKEYPNKSSYEKAKHLNSCIIVDFDLDLKKSERESIAKRAIWRVE